MALVVARLYVVSGEGEQPSQDWRPVATETFSDYNATMRRNPAWRSVGAGRAENFFIPTGTYGWQEWAHTHLKVGEHGVVSTSGPRGVSYISIPKREK